MIPCSQLYYDIPLKYLAGSKCSRFLAMEQRGLNFSAKSLHDIFTSLSLTSVSDFAV